MSFSGTPLGQGRRLDHHTFLNKPHPSNRPLSSNGTSYAYGAPLGSRSPPKSAATTRDRTLKSIDNANEPPLERHSRPKQDRPPTSSGPQTITDPPNPEKWSVKDTSVNIASAFHQAANDMQPNNPNSSWASGSRTAPTVPRSTSVEYEQATQLTNRRLAPPRSNVSRKPLSKPSTAPMADSEGEEDSLEHSRAKSPFDQVIDVAKRALGPTTFFLRHRSQEPDTSVANGRNINGSYDYSAEEREYQAAQNLSSASMRRVSGTHKRGRISLDNKAYRPSKSDLEESDEYSDDDGKKVRRKKKKKEPLGGPLTTLPVTSYDRRKKKKSKKGNVAGAEDDEDSGSDTSDQNALQNDSLSLHSPPISHDGTSNIPSDPYEATNPDISMEVEAGLHSIPEVEEPPLMRRRGKSVDRQLKRSFSLGGALGRMVHAAFQVVVALLMLFWNGISTILFVTGRALGTVIDLSVLAPARWLLSPQSTPIFTLGKYLTITCTLYAAWYILREPVAEWVPYHLSINRPYQAPGVPAANIAELSARLQRLENALASVSQDTVKSKTQYENAAKSHDELINRLGSLESRVQKENVRVIEVEKQTKMIISKGLEALKQEMAILHAQIQAYQPSSRHGESIDEETKAKLSALEERVGSVEGGLKEALEIGKGHGKGSSGTGWWNKPSLGQDAISLINDVVDTAVGRYSKDTLARPDFALHSGGAMIIPSLTSPTFEVKPHNLRGQLIGLLTGNGYAIGRPPITALHHELHNGHCWPFAGVEGQLGVALAAPTYITDVTIDHVAKEVAFDMRSAPRQMELWGMVEGKDNIARVKAWQANKTLMRKEAKARGEELPEDLKEVPYPRTLPKSPQYIRIAKFTYDIHAPHNIQTFPVSTEIRELGVDFGIVVLRVKSNWGRDEFTCLYRLRVHGQRMGETPLPYPEDVA